MVADYTRSVIHKEPSAYHEHYSNQTLYVFALTDQDIRKPIFTSKLISEDEDKPCYKTYIENIQHFLSENKSYINSDKKKIITENINSSICEYGKTKEESLKNMKEKISYNVKMYTELKKHNKEIDTMSLIFFELLGEISYGLS